MAFIQLLCDILPAFVAVADYVASDEAAIACRDDLEDKLPENFYLGFWAELYSLHAVVVNWDWANEPNERQIHKILDVLESRFLKTSQLVKRGWTINSGEYFPRLQSLRRELQPLNESDDEETTYNQLEVDLEEDEVETESTESDLRKLQTLKYLKILSSVTRINQRNDTNQTRTRLLKNLRNGSIYLTLLCFPTTENQASQLSISKYPSKNVRKLAGSLYKLLQRHWCCKCPSYRSHDSQSPHEKRETQLSLAANRRFELTPTLGVTLEEDAFCTDAKFEVLLPTNSDRMVWQETEIVVKHPQNRQYSDIERRPVEFNICQVIESAQGTKLRMMVEDRKLWQLRVQSRLNTIQRSSFKSLEDLLRKETTKIETPVSTFEGKDKLILSFVLATSLLHLHSSHWLKKTWKNENICFLVDSKNGGVLNLRRPYLTSECTPVALAQDAEPLYHFHRYPNILALGIMLLEIARGTRLADEVEESELQDGRYATSKTNGLVALRVFDEWVKDSERSISKIIPSGLRSAIRACLEPAKIPATNPPPSEEQIRQYIFANILAPLGTALSNIYLIPLESLHREMYNEKQPKDTALFDSFDKKHSLDQVKTARKWFERLGHTHTVLEDVNGFPREGLVTPGRVTVAVLDTGFQPPSALMETYQQFNRIKESKSWLIADGNGKNLNEESWQTDLDGHGTQVAELLLRVAPVADVHIAQVFRTRGDLADPHMASVVHQRIADAINYAAKIWKVDIIIMSFGFDFPIPVIRHALQDAVRVIDETNTTRTSTLIFAATRNDGANKDVSWPAKASEVIGISSTDGDGARSSFNPPDDHSSTIFYALGQAVEVVCPTHMGQRYNKTRLSGTSFANPIAAGLAANVLGYVRMFALRSGKSNELYVKEMLETLKSKDGMKAIFQYRMSRLNNDGLASLLPWDWMKKGRWGQSSIFNEVWETLRSK